MPTWKRLTKTGGGGQVDVNLDKVIHMQWFKDHTLLHFGVPDGEDVHSLAVKETPDAILMARPLHFVSAGD